MKKKTLPLALALVMCLGLTVPAFAADAPHDVTLPYDGSMGNDVPGDLIVKNVIATSQVTSSYGTAYTVYDVTVGDVLFQQFHPAADGATTVYEYFIREGEQAANGSFVSASDHTTPLEVSYEIGSTDHFLDYDATKGANDHFTFTCTDADAGKVYCVSLTFEVQVNASGDRRSAAQIEDFFLRINAAQAPIQPTTPPATPATASPTNDSLTADGVLQTPTVYKINGSNYFKIRDLAAILNGSGKQFSVGYDGTLKSVTATTGQGYAKQAGDLAGAPAGGQKTAEPSNDAIYINGEKVEAEVYKIDGSNYFKLRDLGKALNFYVGYSNETGVFIETDKPYAQ